MAHIEQVIAVNLNEHDAELFLKFQKHFALIDMLEQVGAFNIRDGSIRIHFNHQGDIGVIEKQETFRL